MSYMKDLIAGIGGADSRMLTALAAAMLQEVVSREIARQDKGSAEQQTDNTTQAEICSEIIESNNVCQYCQRESDGNCFPCNGFDAHSRFIGRKLSAVR